MLQHDSVEILNYAACPLFSILHPPSSILKLFTVICGNQRYICENQREISRTGISKKQEPWYPINPNANCQKRIANSQKRKANSQQLIANS